MPPDEEPQNEPNHAGVVAPPPLIFAVPLVLSLLANRKLRLGFLPENFRKPVGVSFLAGGLAFGGWFFRAMRVADTPVDPYKPVSRLVIDGPFRLTRNPAYLAFVTDYIGIAALRNSLPSILLLPVILRVMTKGVIEREEAYLTRKFGAEYVRYTERVGRWL